MKQSEGRIAIARELLLVEIERRCADPQCNARTRVGLTKDEARLYCGFECERCGRVWDDLLAERDVPEWWEELAVTGLHAIRPGQVGGEPAEPGEVVERMSESYRRRAAATDEGEKD
jgi:hypothetical protein